MATITPRKSTDGQITFQVKVRLKAQPTEFAPLKRLTDARRWAQRTEAPIREVGPSVPAKPANARSPM